jgi:GT2 family glycosyltransferase
MAVTRTPYSVPIVVVDNRSTEPDADWIRSEFPEVEVVVAPRNDYLFSLNAAVESRREEVVVILNNDMRVDPDFLGPLLRHFRDPDVFAASANVFDWDGTRTTTGQRLMRVRHGWLYQWWAAHPSAPTHTLYAGGGCAAFRRSQYVALGGFDPLYRPAYFEDVDLSYRAWMRGWRTIYEPASVIYHRIGATLWTPDREARMQRMLLRNQALCTVKNVAGWGDALVFIAVLPVRAARMALRGERAGALGLLASISRLPRALWGRAKSPRPLMSPAQIAAGLTAAVAPENNDSRAMPKRLPLSGATAAV